MQAPLIFDAHLDLAMNAMEWNRDLTCPLKELRTAEAELKDKPDRSHGTVCFPEMRRGRVGLCVATQIARVKHNAYSPVFGWHSAAQAWGMTQAQLAWYRAMEEAGEMVQVKDRAGLEKQLSLWGAGELANKTAEAEHPTSNTQHRTSSARLPIGYILSLEGADSILTLQHLERAFGYGLRAIGPAHYGPGVYANGTDATGGFNAKGRELLKEIRRLGLILDVTHLCDDCFWEALNAFDGPMWASHNNCRALVPHNRQFSDEQIKELIRRDAVIGAALDAWMIVPGWVRGQTTPQSAGLKLEKLAEHIDHICQLAGDARHVGIGSDLDGAFGTEQTPADLDSIADLQRLVELLRARAWRIEDVANFAHGNFIRFLRGVWR